MEVVRGYPNGRLRVAVGVAAIAIVAALIFLATGSRAPAAPSATAAASGAKVGIRELEFHPDTLRIGRGTKVVFVNRDRVAHTATRRGAFDTGVIKPGHSAAVRFKRKGVFSYFCRIHHFMHGKIVVR